LLKNYRSRRLKLRSLSVRGITGPVLTGAQTMHDAAQLISLDKAAESLSISRRTVARLVKAGELASVTIGRRRLIRTAALQTWLIGREQHAA